MDGQFKARTIRESKEYQHRLELIQPDVRRIDEQLRGIMWALSCKPDVFPRVDNTKLRRVLTDPWPDAPGVRIYFTFDDNYVELWWIEIVQDK